MDGVLAADPELFSVDRLTAEQYRAFVQLAVNYFAAGYEFYRPAALAPEDQEALSVRFE